MKRRTLALAALAVIGLGGCGNNSSSSDKGGDNQVFFVGYVYDGATGARLPKAALTSVTLLYGDKTIAVDIADDGRFVTTSPLPTWRDYTVKVEATGYREFASYNTGIDVPASLAMTNGVAQAATVQTLDFAAYLFPVALKAPKLTLTATIPDPETGAPVTDKVNGQARLRPQSVPSIFIGGASSTTPAKRVWLNGEDLLTQTIVKPFTNGTISVDEGEMVYGVAYELSIYGVDGYQPLVVSSGISGNGPNVPLVAGFVTSQTFALTPEAQDPLKIVTIDAATCAPPAPTANTYGGKITITFNADIEIQGSTFAEDVDNGLALTFPQTGSSSYCQLKNATGDPGQERGSKVEVGTNSISFSFNPTVGFGTMSQYGTPCTLPPSILAISYLPQTTLTVQPKGNSLRKRTLSAMLNEKGLSSQLSCPMRTF